MDYDKLVQRLHITRSYLANYSTHGLWEEAGVVEQAADAITKLRAERDALAADAARYRWLRGGKEIPMYSVRWARWEVKQWDGRFWQTRFAEQIDDAIDAALAGKDTT